MTQNLTPHPLAKTLIVKTLVSKDSFSQSFTGKVRLRNDARNLLFHGRTRDILLMFGDGRSLTKHCEFLKSLKLSNAQRGFRDGLESIVSYSILSIKNVDSDLREETISKMVDNLCAGLSKEISC